MSLYTLLLLSPLFRHALRADDTEAYAVLVSAVIAETPPTITLSWEQDADPNASPDYTIYRKAAGDSGWGTGTNLGNVLTFADTNVTVGTAYEYQIVKTTTLDRSGYGYIYTGIRAETVPDNRGKLILVVDATHAEALAPELFRLEQDLAGDGWTVIRHDVRRDDGSTNTEQDYIGLGSAANLANAMAVRNLIIGDYNADPDNVKAVLLFGRIPIFRSGDNDIDGHLARPLPADAFYGEMDGPWTTATNSLPSEVELAVGRIDLSRMPGKAVFNGPDTFPSELALLRQYLNKDHAFRQGMIAVERRAIVGEGFGFHNGEAFGASGWRNFTPFFGTANITRAPINTTPGSWQELVCDTENTGTTYLWAEGDGAGSPTSMGALGTHGRYSDVWTRDLVGVDEKGNPTPDIKAVFTIFFGSWMLEWDRTDNLLRSVLASPSMGLTASWSGRPHHFYHHMGLGETVGHGIRVSQNNDGDLYRNHVQLSTRSNHIALMGDPTLRMHPVKPVTALTATGPGTITLNWTDSGDSNLLGCHVYRSANSGGPYTRLTPSPITPTTYADTPDAGIHTYMVRAVKLESGSGTYLNLSQGTFVTADTAGGGAGNNAPIVSAGPDRTIAFPLAAALSGSVSDDGLPASPRLVTSTWSKVSGPGNVTFTNTSSPLTSATFSQPGTYVLRLSANDGALASRDEMVVTVKPPVVNQAPAVSAGADRTVLHPVPAILIGNVTDDGIPNATTIITWSKTSGPGTVTFGDPSLPATTGAFSTSGVYTLRLTADDGELTAFDELVVTVMAAAPPGNGSEFVVDANTIALYHFNGDYSDSSGNGYHLIAAGGVVRTDANRGWMNTPSGEVARFSNLGDELASALPDSALLGAPGAEISIEARIFIRNYLTNEERPNVNLLDLYQSYDAELALRDSRYQNPPGPYLFGAFEEIVVTSGEWAGVSKNAWHRLLITFDANDAVKCYIDGTQIGSTVTAPANRQRISDWFLALGNFDGDIDEVRVSNMLRPPNTNPPAPTFATWQSLVFTEAQRLDPRISGYDADPDHDGLINLIEYALSLNPLTISGDGTRLSTETVEGKTYLRIQFSCFANASDLTCEPKVSPNLQDWTDDVVEISRVPNLDQTETVIFRDTVAIEDSPRRFIKLQVIWSGAE